MIEYEKKKSVEQSWTAVFTATAKIKAADSWYFVYSLH